MNKKFGRTITGFDYGCEVYIVAPMTSGKYFKVISPSPEYPTFISDIIWQHSTGKLRYYVNGTWYDDDMVFATHEAALDKSHKLSMGDK